MLNRIALKNVKKRLQVSDVGIYFIVYGASVVVALIKTLYIASALVPEQMGWFISLSLVSALMIYFCNLGVMDAYLIRTKIVQRRDATAALLRGQLYLVTVVMSSITTVLVVGYGYFYAQSQYQVLHLALVAAYLFLQPLQAALLIDLQADRKLIKYSTFTLIKSLAPLITIASTISINPIYVDINFVLICEVLTTSTLIGLAVSNYKHNLILKLRRKLVKRLAKQGIYFTGQTMLNNLSSNLDKWFVLTIYGLASAGAYSLSNQMILAGSAIGGMVTTYMTPHVTINRNNKKYIIKNMNMWSSVLAASVAILSLVGVYAFWENVIKYYSRYTLSFEVFAYSSVTMAFISANFYEVYFRATKSGKYYFNIHLASNIVLVLQLLTVYLLKLDVHWVAFSVMFVKIFIWTACRVVATLHSKSI